MAISPFVKGETDWHEKLNNNFNDVQNQINRVSGDAQEALSTKLDAPVEQTLDEGFVYRNADGTTRLTDGGNEAGKFLYSFIMDNGADGTPSAVEYADDCAGFIEARVSDLGDWANTDLVRNYFRPCVIDSADGAPKYYLQQDHMTLKEDGTAAVLTGADGDVMIEVKKLWGKITKVGNKAKFSIANYELDGGFCFNNVGGVDKDVVYRGAYKAGTLSGAGSVMRSVSGVAPLVSQTRATMRGYAANRGSAYHQNNFYMLALWQIVFVMLYKTRDAQTALGQGRSLSTNTAAANTGSTNNRPFCWGDQGGVNSVKFLGVEDFYGNVWEWVDGLVFASDVYKATKNPAIYNDTGNGYEYSLASGMTKANNNDKYVTKVAATNQFPMVPVASGGSSSTFFCDNVWLDDNVQVATFGGSWDSAARVGAFSWALVHAVSVAYPFIGSRLCRA